MKVTAADKERFQQRKRRWDTILASGSAAASPAPVDVKEESATAEAPQGSDQHGAAHEGHTGPGVCQGSPQNCTLDIDQCVSCINVCGQMSSMHAELDRLLEENVTLKKELSAVRLDEEFFSESDEKARDDKVEYYTGLPCWSLLHALHAVITPCLTKGGRKLTPFQMLLLTLMRLRLDLSEQHLGYLFRISSVTTSKMFRKTLGALHFHLSPLVGWPARESLLHTMPRQFKEAFGGRVAIILDCFEIGTEKPSYLKAQSEIYSHFNQTDTVKYLLGITPQGSVCFVSEGCGQRVGDKRLTEQCGILDKLLPGDFLLADRGFNVGDEVGLMCAELKPPALAGGAQMNPKSAQETQKIAQLRVHVEKVVGLVRDKYSILQHALPVSILAPLGGEAFQFIDKIVTVCCALTNMSPSVVLQPQDHVIPDSDGETE